jgi:hypothetical protein
MMMVVTVMAVALHLGSSYGSTPRSVKLFFPFSERAAGALFVEAG